MNRVFPKIVDSGTSAIKVFSKIDNFGNIGNESLESMQGRAK